MSRQPPNNPDLQEQLRLAKELRFRGGYSGRSTSRGSLHGADSTRGRGSIHVRSFGPTGASEFSQSYQTSRQGISRASPGSSGFSTGAVTTAIASSTPRSAAIPLITRRNPATSANGASNDVPPHLKNMPHTKFVARPAEAAFDLQAPTIFRDITNQPASQPLVTGSKGNGGSNKDVNVDICPDDKDNIFMAQRSTSGSGSASGDFTTTASRQLKINGHSMPETSEQTDMANELPSMARIPVNRRSEVPIVASLYRPKTSSPVPKPSTSLPFNNRSHLQAVPQPIARNIHLATNEESIRYDTSQAAVQGVSSGSPHHIRRISNSGDIEMTGVSEANTRPAARKHGGIVASVWADFSSPGSTTTPPAESDSSNKRWTPTRVSHPTPTPTHLVDQLQPSVGGTVAMIAQASTSVPRNHSDTVRTRNSGNVNSITSEPPVQVVTNSQQTSINLRHGGGRGGLGASRWA